MLSQIILDITPMKLYYPNFTDEEAKFQTSHG